MQATARENRSFVDNLGHLLIKELCFVDFFRVSVIIRVYSILAFSSKEYPFKRDFTSMALFPGSLISSNSM